MFDVSISGHRLDVRICGQPRPSRGRHGSVTIRYRSKLHHIGMGRARNGTRIVLLVAGRHIRIIDRNGELLRDFELDPSRDYQPRSLG